MNTSVDPQIDGPDNAVLDMDRLITMANQIGDFFAPYPPMRRTEGIRNHLRTYWDPRMREALLKYIKEQGGKNLHDHVIAGAKALIDIGTDKKGYYGPPQA
jgi:formate dehydrogenase subunit delta